MQIFVSKPHLEKYIESQINEGRFTTPTDVVEAALAQLMESDAEPELDEETCNKALRANAQIDRGEGRTLEAVATELRSRFGR